MRQGAACTATDALSAAHARADLTPTRAGGVGGGVTVLDHHGARLGVARDAGGGGRVVRGGEGGDLDSALELDEQEKGTGLRKGRGGEGWSAAGMELGEREGRCGMGSGGGGRAGEGGGGGEGWNGVGWAVVEGGERRGVMCRTGWDENGTRRCGGRRAEGGDV